ncbi:hyalin-like, partial [Saccoglossus kowalevskii]
AESPVVICPADIFQNTDDGASWANVTWGAVNATDNSGSVIDVYVYHAPGSNFPIGSTIVTYSAVDAYNNTGYCSFSVTIIDAESPVVICPADILQNTDDGASWANVTWGAVNATDNSGSVTNVYVSHAPSNAESPVVICQADILQNTDDGAPWANVTWGVVNATDNSGSVSDIYVSHAPDSNFPIGSTIVTYSAVDAYNNTGYCSFSVTVIDAESPVVICPADIFQNTEDGATWANVTWGVVNATDNSGSVTDLYVSHAPSSNFSIGSTQVTYSAVDAYNNTGHCSFIVTIINAESPVVICPADIFQNTDDGASWANVTWGAVNATDNSGSVIDVYVYHAPGSNFPIGSTIVTYSAVDAYNNTGYCSFSVTIIDAESPVVICPADILQNTDDGAPWANVTWGVVNATDNSGSVTDLYVSHAPSSNFPIGSTQVTYSAVDAYNNTGHCSFIVTIINAESPVVICPADIFQNTDDGASWANVTWGAVNATDNSGSVIDVYVYHAPGSNFPIGSTIVTYSAVDAYNNTGYCSFSVTIIDAESPVVICPADILQNTDDGASWANVTWGAVNATDNSGSVTNVYVSHAPSSNFPIGSTIVTYSAVDAYNNTGYCSFIVTVIDAESPVVICPADILQNTDDGAPWANVTWGVVNATDNSGSVTDLYVSHAPSSNFPIGSTQVTYSAVDAYNNTGHCSFIVTIINAESPVVICPADIFQNTDDGASWANVTWGAVNATDNSGSVIDVYVYHAPGSNFPIGSTIVTYSAVDAYNNTGYCSFSVTIIDAESPVVICPADILQNTDDGASWANVTWGAVNATDNSGSVTNVYVSHAPSSNFPIGSTIVTYSAVDAYNNTGYCSFIVTVIDAESPVVICPADILQNTDDGAPWANVTWGVVNATDNSGSVSDIYVSHAPDSNFPIGSTIVTYSAVDAYNNTGYCSFSVTVIDAESPVVICPADIFQNTDDGATWANVTWGVVNATDNSGSVTDLYVSHAPSSNFPIGSTQTRRVLSSFVQLIYSRTQMMEHLGRM